MNLRSVIELLSVAHTLWFFLSQIELKTCSPPFFSSSSSSPPSLHLVSLFIRFKWSNGIITKEYHLSSESTKNLRRKKKEKELSKASSFCFLFTVKHNLFISTKCYHHSFIHPSNRIRKKKKKKRARKKFGTVFCSFPFFFFFCFPLSFLFNFVCSFPFPFSYTCAFHVHASRLLPSDHLWFDLLALLFFDKIPELVFGHFQN